MQPLAFVTGTLLALGATALLIGDGYASGHWTISHALQPLLVFGTVASAVMVHRGPWLAKPLFLALAALGSLATLYGTLGRTSSAADLDQSQRENRLLALSEARLGAKKECGRAGDRCKYWQARIDGLTEAGSTTVDPRGEAISKLATLAGLPGDRVKQLSGALEPVLLPLFLELGSVLFFTVAFPIRKKVKESETLALKSEEIETVSVTKDAALRDFRSMRQAGAQKVLAERWGVSEGTVSKWLSSWESDGLVDRKRRGKEKPVLALPAPGT